MEERPVEVHSLGGGYQGRAGREGREAGAPRRGWRGSCSYGVYDASERVGGSAIAEVKTGWFETDLVAPKGETRTLAAGVYFATVTAGGTTLRRKIVVVR
jgi:hypothetical protein